MQDQQAFEKLKTFFESHPASLEASRQLRNGTEVGVVINEHLECTFIKNGSGDVSFQRRKPIKPDFVFYFSPEMIDPLINSDFKNMFQAAIYFFKCYLAGSLKFKYLGSPTALYLKGYYKLIKEAGKSLF